MTVKIVIFCGGLATRFNNGKPGPLKPLIKIKNKPILEHILERYKYLKNPEFILLGGYKYNELKKLLSIEEKNVKNLEKKFSTICSGKCGKENK